MKRVCQLLGPVLVGICATASAIETELAPLISSSCIDCHDADTKTGLNFETLGHDLTDPNTFRLWEEVYDQLREGNMPPEEKPRPEAVTLGAALRTLRDELHSTSMQAQKENGRAPVRRLTGIEYEYTLHDLLGIGGELAKRLPPGSATSRFDTVSDGQGISSVHIRSYLAAADRALDEAIQLGRRPASEPQLIDYQNSRYVGMWSDRPIRNGGGTIKKVDGEIVTFEPRPHVLRSDHVGYRPPYPGFYRIMIGASGYQATTPVTLALMRSSEQEGGSELIGAFELPPGENRTIDTTTYLTPDDFFYPSVADLNSDPRGHSILNIGAKQYEGEGVAISWLTIQGPLEASWPPARTRALLHGIGLTGRKDGSGFELSPTRNPLAHVAEIVSGLAPRAFRRPVGGPEVQDFIDLAKPALRDGRGLEQALRLSLRALFSSPQFLYHSAATGQLNEHALATRLSYFLWKSLPDEELTRMARENKLSDPATLSAQVERMLDDEKSIRFVRDFLGQWSRLYEIDATTPDDKLYPEYDDALRQAMLRESELFFAELIASNLPARNLIDTDFTFLNRRLAVHYGIQGIHGERFRQVSLPADSPRGGLLTQASVLKITANGTVTSPVKRGAFVLANLLGQPPSPPPPTAGTIEPDTRGTTTIRETLDAHRNNDSCARCHREIDPPGFALESFDPIGGFRTRYRSTEIGDRPKRRLFGRQIYEYKVGQAVDPSGSTAEGEAFAGIRDFKRLLLAKEEQVVRNLLTNLLVYSTGAEIQFADREEINEMLDQLSREQFGVRSMIQRVVGSRIFRTK